MESHPSAPAAARGPAPGGQESEQRRRAVEVGTHLKKVIDAYRMFESGHEAQGALEEVLWDRLRSYLDRFGDLSLELSATTISIEGKDVITASRPEESITFALFIDGIHEVLILKGIERPELVAFLRLWSEAAKRPDEGATPIREDESVLTRFWEADFENVELVAMEATAESASSESDAEMQERHQELRRVMRSMAGSLPDGTRTTRDGGAFGEAFWSVGAGAESPGAHRDESRRPADDPIALRMWQAELGVAIDAASIAKPRPAARGADPGRGPRAVRGSGRGGLGRARRRALPRRRLRTDRRRRPGGRGGDGHAGVPGRGRLDRGRRARPAR
jgi:hypothetical protein